MSEPDDSLIRWELIFRGTGVSRRGHSRQVWAQICEAVRTADLLRAGEVRGDAGWCRAAADTYGRLHHSDAYAHLSRQAGWAVDEHLVRALLDAPPVPPGAHATILEAYGFDSAFGPTQWTHPVNLTVLVATMQELGIVGVAGQRVSVLRAVENGATRDDLVQVVQWQGSNPPRASDPVAVRDLVPAAGTPADRIVAALQAVAGIAADMAGTDHPPPGQARHRLTDQPLPANVDGHPLGSRGRPFRLITGGDATPPPPQSPAAPAARHRRTGPHT
jgi:hypothetical protein